MSRIPHVPFAVVLLVRIVHHHGGGDGSFPRKLLVGNKQTTKGGYLLEQTTKGYCLYASPRIRKQKDRKHIWFSRSCSKRRAVR